MTLDLDHFDRLSRLLDLERRAEVERYEQLVRALSPAERAARGAALVDLVASDESWGLGGRLLVTLSREDARPLDAGARLGVGDPVAIRPRRSPEVEPARGVIARRSRERVVIAFDRPPPPFVTDGRVVVDLVPNDVTHARARANLAAVSGWERGAERRRRGVLLGAEPPRPGTPRAIVATRPLNPEQLEAATRALAAEDFFLVHGPPGTGKSTVLAEVAAQAVARGERVLATAASNAAVDHLLELCLDRGLRAVRVGHPARVAERLAEHTLDLLVEAHADRALARELDDEAHELLGYARRQRRQGRARERFANARDAQREARQLLDEARHLERRAVRAILDGAQVTCATATALGGGELEGARFDLAILDEATQAIEPIALAPWLRAPRVVLAGDHLQLGPTVLSREAESGGLGKSLFERLLDAHGDGVKVMLREQYRMNARIMAFPSRMTYGGALRAHPSVAERTLADVLVPDAVVEAPPVLFLDTAGKGFAEEQPEGSESRRNPGEAALVIARLVELLAAGLDPSEIAVIAPYAAQVSLVRDLARARELPSAIEIDTVDAFQGREKDAVLVTLVRSNSDGALGFLEDLRRMNVALTRARRHLFVVADSATIASHAYYAELVEEAQREGGYRSAWEWPPPE